MKVVVIGNFTQRAKENIASAFPASWEICPVAPGEAAAGLLDADAVIPEHTRVNAELLDRAPGLRLVQTGAGFDNVEIEECTKRGIWVCNAAGVNAAAVAEHVMAFLLCWYKNIPALDRFLKERRPEEELDYAGSELAGKTVGIVGLGAVGRTVAGYCGAFGMQVLGYSYRPVDVPGVRCLELEQLYAQSDVITLHVPLRDATWHMLDREAFAKMKRDALIINTARGAVVDETELIEALRTHRIGGACLDVFETEPLADDSPLRRLPNVILTPHTAGLPDGVKFHRKRYEFFAENIARVMSGQRPEHALNEIPGWVSGGLPAGR